jgi:hypothetical protein
MVRSEMAITMQHTISVFKKENVAKKGKFCGCMDTDNFPKWQITSNPQQCSPHQPYHTF